MHRLKNSLLFQCDWAAGFSLKTLRVFNIIDGLENRVIIDVLVRVASECFGLMQNINLIVEFHFCAQA
jgi:hypothetical protein